MTPPLIRLPHGSDAPSIPVRLTWLVDAPAIDVGEADEEAMAEIRRWMQDVRLDAAEDAGQEDWVKATREIQARLKSGGIG